MLRIETLVKMMNPSEKAHRRWRKRLGLYRAVLVFCVALPAARPVQGHVFWLEPSSYQVEVGHRVSLSFREGHGEGHPLGRNERRLERFEVHGPGGMRAVPGANGIHPAGILPPPEPGLYLAGYLNTPAPHRLPAERFERYLVEEGLERISELRRQRGDSGKAGNERFYRCAKSLFQVGGTGEGDVWRRELGFPLELIPETDPTRWGKAESLTLRILFRGEPLAGALIVAVARDGREGETGRQIRLRSDREGRVRLPTSSPGRWLVRTVHMAEAPTESGVDWESWWASLTFAVGE